MTQEECSVCGTSDTDRNVIECHWCPDVHVCIDCYRDHENSRWHRDLKTKKRSNATLTQDQPETRNVSLTVESITGPQKSSGDWPIRAIVDGLGKYAMPLFVSSVVSPEPGATYQATLVQGNQKPGTDGSAPWHFFWNVVTWGSHTAPGSPITAPQQPAQAPQQAQGVPVPAAPDGGWNTSNDIDRREALKEVSFHKQKALEQATLALGTTTESALLIADYMEQRAWLYRDALALLREPLAETVSETEEEEDEEEQAI